MKSFVVILSVVLANALVQGTNVTKCTENPGELPVSTSIAGCESPPCILYKRENATINITFTAPSDITSMTTLATAYLPFGKRMFPVPYNLKQQADTCKFLSGTQCPISEGELVKYTLTMYIKRYIPAGATADIEFRVVDQDMNPVFCFRTSVKIGAVRKDASAAETEQKN